MKASVITAFIAAAGVFWGLSAHGQYKSPRSYLQRNNPGQPGQPGGGSQPGTPGTSGAASAPGRQQPAKPQQPKFKDLPVNSQFYFLADTNRAFTWTKISSTTATNLKNGVVQMISAEVPVQK